MQIKHLLKIPTLKIKVNSSSLFIDLKLLERSCILLFYGLYVVLVMNFKNIKVFIDQPY